MTIKNALKLLGLLKYFIKTEIEGTIELVLLIRFWSEFISFMTTSTEGFIDYLGLKYALSLLLIIVPMLLFINDYSKNKQQIKVILRSI